MIGAAARFSSSPEALSYAWRQLASRVGLKAAVPGGNGFEELPVEVHYGMPGDTGPGRSAIVVVPCCESAWENLLSAPPDSLAWLPSRRVMPGGTPAPVENTVPVLLWGKGFEGGEKPFAEQRPDGSVVFHADIVASAFFMLSRWEETVVTERDRHDRFPGRAGVSHRQGFMDRPIIDEYALVLRAWLGKLLPAWSPMPRQGEVFVTCDVDQPYDPSLGTPARAVKRIAGDLLKRRSPGMAVSSMRQAMARSRGDWSLDPYNTFDWIMDVCESADRKLAFYILAQSPSEMDARYGLDENFMGRLMKKIHACGHEIGLHGSYGSYRDPGRIAEERAALLHACRSRGIDQDIKGNRQHYLRWDASETADHLDAAGFEYDSSGYFADAPGFRYGTSHPFGMWSWRRNGPLKLMQRPLIVMEDSVIGDTYLGMGCSGNALAYMLALKNRSLATGGDFTLLWHNSGFGCDAARRMYRELVA